MTTLIRRRPAGITSFGRSHLPALFDWRPFYSWDARERSDRSILGVDAYSDDDKLVVTASVPGVEPDAIEVTLDNGILKIEAVRESDTENDGGGYVVRERSHGKFQRTLRLPDGIDADNADAKVENGVLTVTIPRSETSRAKRIEVKSG